MDSDNINSLTIKTAENIQRFFFFHKAHKKISRKRFGFRISLYQITVKNNLPYFLEKNPPLKHSAMSMTSDIYLSCKNSFPNLLYYKLWHNLSIDRPQNSSQ